MQISTAGTPVTDDKNRGLFNDNRFDLKGILLVFNQRKKGRQQGIKKEQKKSGKEGRMQ